MAVTVAGDEKVMVAELTGGAWSLAVVGGHAGRRGPLVLCDAVKARRPDLPTLVLVGQETEEAAFDAHEERHLEAVRYLNLRGVAATLDELKSARILALEMLGLEEDPDATEAWQQQVAALEVVADHETVEEVPTADDASAPIGPLTAEDLEFAHRTVAETRHIDFRSPVPAAQAVDAADRQTAKLRDRICELERSLARMAHVYGGRVREFDGAAEKLAGAETRNASLKRDLHRLREYFAEEREHWKSHRIEAEGRATSVEEHAALLDGRVAETTEEISRLRRELEEKEGRHTSLLQQAQEAFATLKESAGRATANLSDQLATLEQQLTASREEITRLRLELETAHDQRSRAIADARVDLEARIRELEVALGEAKQRHDAELAARRQCSETHRAQLQDLEERAAGTRRALEERAAMELRQRSEELAAVRTRLAEGVAREQELGEQLRAATEEVARQQNRLGVLAPEMGERTGEAEQLRVLGKQLAAAREEQTRLAARAGELEEQAVPARIELEVARWQHTEEVERLVAERAERREAATIRNAHGQRFSRVGDLQAEIERLRADLAARDAELAAAHEQHRHTSRAFEQELSRSLETVLDARLSAVEEFSRAASDRMAEQQTILTQVAEGSRRQEQFLEGLAALRARKPPPTPFLSPPGGAIGRVAGGGDTDEDLARLARRLMDARAHEQSARPALWRWLRESPVHMLAAVFCGVIVAAAVVFWLPTLEGVPTPTASVVARFAGPEPSRPLIAAEPLSEEEVGEDTPKLVVGEPAVEAGEPNTPRAKEDLSLEEVTERRALRGGFFEAYKSKKWGRAVQLGTELRDRFFLDWESHLRFADATRRSGDIAGAMALYSEFVQRFPDNAFAEEAQMRAANLLVKLDRVEEAVPMLEQLVKDGRFRKQARQALKSLEP
jgi:uncharacterized small protein (DUF1192 family)